jgi:hypothetical protein
MQVATFGFGAGVLTGTFLVGVVFTVTADFELLDGVGEAVMISSTGSSLLAGTKIAEIYCIDTVRTTMKKNALIAGFIISFRFIFRSP